ncbi:hypothetical protein [Chondromyces crocatus]|uniref:Uncharacterized protein n=1 Tax=Chondromyces crocatus TaxID=52 RepID=A0A0K1ENT7_CHOCO|nr:hypothetical protein [Chondromyces crocatus]AKT42283.1 uncharacterized protein CMC5_065060 [Chondromyces crocatus]
MSLRTFVSQIGGWEEAGGIHSCGRGSECDGAVVASGKADGDLVSRPGRGQCIASFLGLLLVLFTMGCGRRPPHATPEGSVRELTERLQRLHGDPGDAKAIYDLLSQRARDNLLARAQRYSAATGKMIAPEAMIVPSRFQLHFEPQNYVAQIAGTHALVEVAGILPGHRAQVPCVFEDSAWRVDVALPPLPPVQKRPGSE